MSSRAGSQFPPGSAPPPISRGPLPPPPIEQNSPPFIVNKSMFEEGSPTRYIDIYGETHQHLDNFTSNFDVYRLMEIKAEEYFSSLLLNDSMAIMFIEKAPPHEGAVSNDHGVIITHVAGFLKKSYPERVEFIDNRPHERPKVEEKARRKELYLEYTQRLIPSEGQSVYDKFPAIKDLIEEDTAPEKIPLIIDDNIVRKCLDPEYKGNNLIFWVGEGHRDNVSRILQSEPTKRFRGASLTQVSLGGNVNVQPRMFNTQIVEKGGSLRVRGRHPLRRSLLL